MTCSTSYLGASFTALAPLSESLADTLAVECLARPPIACAAHAFHEARATLSGAILDVVVLVVAAETARRLVGALFRSGRAPTHRLFGALSASAGKVAHRCSQQLRRARELLRYWLR